MNIAANNKDTSTSDDSGFWLLCTDEGKISVSSREAVRAGFTSGVKSASDVIAEDQIPELEDVLRIVSKGGDVSVLMSASPATGYSIAHLSSGVLFSAAVVEIRLYKNKSEYLADFQRDETAGSAGYSVIWDTARILRVPRKKTLFLIFSEAVS